MIIGALGLAGGCGCLLLLPGGPSGSGGTAIAAPTAHLSSRVVSSEFVSLPGGTFLMGDTIDRLRDARPHQVTLSPYLIARHETTQQGWDAVVAWGRGHGYTDLPLSRGRRADHPVCAVAWHDAIKWCNARSEMEGRTPCYYADQRKQEVVRTGHDDLTNRCVRWEADGYRLPTEAEWEMAARSGREGRRFPWGDEITHQHANYSGTTDTSVPYDRSSHKGPAGIYAAAMPCTAPVGSFAPNEFGLHDMAGNVWEWCWDFYDKYYGVPELHDEAFTSMALTAPPSTVTLKDPHGPEFGSTSVVRGGSWRHTAAEARCAARYDLPGDGPSYHVGFRVVRVAPQEEIRRPVFR